MLIKVLLVDDDEIITSSLQMILNMENDIHVVGTCKNGEDAYRRVVEYADVDVILLDIRMPVCDGVLATKKIMMVRPDCKIIILTTFDDDEYIFEALRHGAKGYLLKNVSPDKIIEAIRVVHSGSLLVHSEVAQKLTGMLHKDEDGFLSSHGLSETEEEIVRLIADGYSNREIADKVFLSEGTVKNKVSDILHKLKLRDRTQIAVFYLKGGKTH